MKYYFPIHLDGGNRGCEAIAKGSAMLLGEPKENLIGRCRDIQLDTRLGVDQYVTLMPAVRGSYIVDRSLGFINKLLRTQQTMEWRQLYPYRHFLSLIQPGDIMLSTGGDMMCYDDNEVIYTNNYLHRHGVKTVLWGCSMGPDNLTQAKRDTLFRFSLVYARESLTYDFFQQLGLQKLCLCPDPAFILPAEECPLPTCLQQGQRVVGLNISNYVMGGTALNSRFGKEVVALIEHILNTTNLHVLLVPHVTWNDGNINQDDREINCTLKEQFANSSRISCLNINQLNYCNIRYIISKCALFIGARTHAVISAYSMCVPTIALGYSIKSRGIAKDLQLDSQLVVDSKNFTPEALIDSFNYLTAHEKDIRKHLAAIMPAYKQSTYSIRQQLQSLNTSSL